MTATIISPDTIEAAPARRIVRPIPTTRLVKIELRKMFNTRSGFWMLVSIGVLSVVATGRSSSSLRTARSPTRTSPRRSASRCR